MQDYFISLPVTLQSFSDGESRPNRGSDIPYHPDNGCRPNPSCLTCPLPVCVLNLAREKAVSLRAAQVRRRRVAETAREYRNFSTRECPGTRRSRPRRTGKESSPAPCTADCASTGQKRPSQPPRMKVSPNLLHPGAVSCALRPRADHPIERPMD